MSGVNHPTPEKKGRRLKYRILKPHRPSCRAMMLTELRDPAMRWPTPWAYLDHVDYRDALGRRHRYGTRWWVIACNCSDCNARIAVNESSILEALPHG